MALKTQGFSLSALPRSPSVPNNIGVLDMKAIDDGVRRALANFETIRTLPQSMALADAQMQAKAEQAPLQTRGILAETEAAEAQLPFRTAILAAEASPEMQEAKRQALLNRSIKQPSGDVQLATALAAAKQRLAEDATDAAAAQLIAVLEPMAVKKSAVSMANPQGVIDAGVNKTADTLETRRDITGQQIASREGMAERALAQGSDLKREGFTSSQDVARIGAQGRIDAARATNVGKLYEGAIADNQRIQQSLASLSVIEDKIDDYRKSPLGSGPVVGSEAGLFVRNLFGDPSGQALKAAVSQEMANAVQTIRGLGAMSDTEFRAVMDQLPRTSDVGGALDTKLSYMQALRPWLAARSNLYLSELEKGTSPITAHQKVREAFPMPGIGGTTPIQPMAAPLRDATPAPASAAPAEFKIIEIR